MPSTLGQFVPIPVRPQAYLTGAVNAVRVSNGSPYRLRVLLGGQQYDMCDPGADNTYVVTNLSGYGGWVLLIPGKAPLPNTSLNFPDGSLNASVTVTTYGGGDTIPYGTQTQLSEALYSSIPDTILDSMAGALTFKARVFGARGDGKTDDRLALQAILSVIQVTGGGTLDLGTGKYAVSGTGTCPTDNTIPCALAVPSNTQVIGGGALLCELFLLPGATDQCNVLMNWFGSAIGGNDQHIVIRDLSVNGNSVNQAAANRHQGIWYSHMRDLKVLHCNVRNIYSQGSGAAKESHCIIAYQSSDVLFEGCVAYSDDGGGTASGIGGSDCEALRIVGCVSHDLNDGWGITTYDCSGLTITGCNIYICAEGLFCEICTDVTLEGCVVGGTAPFQAICFPFSAGQALGCTANVGAGGISLRGCVNVRVNGCTSSNNSGTGNCGLLIQNESSPSRNSANIVVTNCRFASNQNVGAYCNNTADVTFIGCHFVSNGASGLYVDTIAAGVVEAIGCISTGNTNYGYECHGSTSPFVWLRDCQASGNTVADVLDNATSQPIMGLLTAPGVPATATALHNPYCRTVDVYVNTGTATFTGTGTQINGSTSGATTGLFRLRPNETITLNYSAGTPAWTWFAN